MGEKPGLVEMLGEMQTVAVRAGIPNKILTLPTAAHPELIPPHNSVWLNTRGHGVPRSFLKHMH